MAKFTKNRIRPRDLKTGDILQELKNGKLPSWQRFKAVNIWKKSFGPVATMAIFDLYSQNFGVTYAEARRLKFTHCIESLRELDLKAKGLEDQSTS